MRLTRSVSLRMRLKKKKNQSRFWGLASFRRQRKLVKNRTRRHRQVRLQAEYVHLASCRQPEQESLKLVA
ncbi:hypothetical protein [Photobacterium rosenbergii]|uniref:50S ribosomal protein L34 n=1 Tax=Photobacterium rosenbergii TaxID=294936 RepID=A0ABU3ZHA1_9GAMM|nr:hypothetical protein [Photobacterium rosenbergii]MDV5169465.1 hypothetical protein [Photobacterium rosenbergii]